jgi:hypothetical protein
MGEGPVLPVVSTALGTVRKAKSDQKKSMASAVESFRVRGSPEELSWIQVAEVDLLAASRAGAIRYEEGEFVVDEVVLED